MDIYCTACIDLEKIGELYEEWTGKPYSDGYMLFNSLFCVARDREDNGRIVGCAQLIVMADPFFQRYWGLVENVYVTEGFQRRGVGKEMMKMIEAEAKAFRCEFIKLTSRKLGGVALYRSLGYEEATSFRKELA